MLWAPSGSSGPSGWFVAVVDIFQWEDILFLLSMNYWFCFMSLGPESGSNKKGREGSRWMGAAGFLGARVHLVKV